MHCRRWTGAWCRLCLNAIGEVAPIIDSRFAYLIETAL
jgi:hypothetical protein